MKHQGQSRPKRTFKRGFTLIELLVVIAMIGVLAAIAIVGYRKYLSTAHTADAKAVMSAIRVAQEAYRAETLVFADCGNAWYPDDGGPNGNRFHFLNDAHPQWACWRALNVQTDSPTKHMFATVDVVPGGAWPTTVPTPTGGGFSNSPFPTAAPLEPGYMIFAAGNDDGDTSFSLFASSSLNGEIYVEREYE